jgi:hypothetical protein
MDRDKDAKLTYDEFVEGSKQDPTIVQARAARAPHTQCTHADAARRHYRCTTASYDPCVRPPLLPLV